MDLAQKEVNQYKVCEYHGERQQAPKFSRVFFEQWTVLAFHEFWIEM